MRRSTTGSMASEGGRSDLLDEPLRMSPFAVLKKIALVYLCWVTSATVAVKVRCASITATQLAKVYNDYAFSELLWIGKLYGVLTVILMPLICGLLDYYKISLRIALISAAFINLTSCLASAALSYPHFLIITDSILCGIGSTLTLSVIVLLMDQEFPESSAYRIIATSLCQGSVVGAFYVLDLYSLVMIKLGFSTFNLILGFVLFLEAGLVIPLLPEIGFNSFSLFKEDEEEVRLPNEEALEKLPLRERILGLTLQDIDKSPAIMPWLLNQLFIELTVNGILEFLFQITQLTKNPEWALIHGFHQYDMYAAFSFTGGQTLTYLIGASMGYFIQGYLVHVYMVSNVGLFISLIVWQLLRLQYASLSLVVLVCVCAFLSGAFIGLQQTFLFAASKEATLIPSRRIFPFTQIMTGIAICTGPLLYGSFSQISTDNIWLAMFAVMSVINFGLVAFNLHKVYMYRHEKPFSQNNHIVIGPKFD